MAGHIYIVDDDAGFRNSLVALLGSVGLTCDSFSSPEKIPQLKDLKRPGCMIVDYRLPDISGLQLLKTIRVSSSIPVIIISAYTDVRIVVAAMRAGAAAVFEKPLDNNEFIESVEEACFLDRGIALARRRCDFFQARLATLTKIELEILHLMVECKETKEIAHNLGKSLKSIERYRTALVAKLGCRTISEALIAATRCPARSISPLTCGDCHPPLSY